MIFRNQSRFHGSMVNQVVCFEFNGSTVHWFVLRLRPVNESAGWLALLANLKRR